MRLNIPRIRIRVPKLPRVPLPAALRRREHLPRYAVVFALLLDVFEFLIVAFAASLTVEALLPGSLLSPLAHAAILGVLAFSLGALAWVSWRSTIPFPVYARPARQPGIWIGIAWLAFTLTLSFLPPISWVPPVVIAVSAGFGFLAVRLMFRR